jgi:hypothetical protein
MTSKRRDDHSTEFGLWLREQPEIDSQRGFIASNIDYIWRNYKTGEWMLIEEKRYGRDCAHWQRELFAILDNAARHDPKYRGFYFIRFEQTNPDDGRIWINSELATKESLLRLLQFQDVKTGDFGT